MLTWLLYAALASPPCVQRAPDMVPRDALPADTGDAEILARLVYAEATSTGSPDDPLVHRGIAWGAMNRVRLAAASPSAARSYGSGVRGVVFKSGQFNPAVSARSPFAAEFLCPTDEARWARAESAAAEAIAGEHNPFIQTAWEQAHGLSLVVNFYYPASIQARGPLAPWEGSGSLTFLGDVATAGGTISSAKVRFYRLTAPPTDVR
ncbi:MAG TPA: cell wall hydrolase [Myxococcota bacterium]|nr:cell wall hydrolase [Myxococcota bacterium]